MKYGILFSTAAVLLLASAIVNGGTYITCVWPAVSFATVAAGYFALGPCVFGKSKSGSLSAARTMLLLPYLLYMWSVWYLVRIFKRENAIDQLTDSIWIGRRLLNHEFPENIDHVVDLTCEFSEPSAMTVVDYYSFQILDGFVPQADQLREWVAATAKLDGNIFIHCAEGHGRTGLFAAALLVEVGIHQTVDEALEFVKSKRPLVRLGKKQTAVLHEYQNGG